MDKKDHPRALKAIGLMLAGFPSSQSAITEATADAYLMAVSRCDIAGIEAACGAFLQGQVSGHDRVYPPTAPQLASMAQALGDAAQRLAEGPRLVTYRIGGEPPKGYVPLGGKEDRWAGRSKPKQIASDKA